MENMEYTENSNIDGEDDGFGNTEIDEAFDGWREIKLRMPDEKKGESSTELVVRLLPAIKSCKESGKWNVFYARHYGHNGENARKPDKPRARPFKCIQEKNFKSGKIEVSCPKCEEMERYRLKETSLQGEIQRANPEATEKQLRELYKQSPKLVQISEWLRKNNCDKKFWMNVMTLKGEFGPLQVSYKTFQKLRDKLRKLRDEEKIDAFHPDKGVWLRFTRTGTGGFNVNDEVEPVMESVEVNGRTYKEIKTAPLTKEQRARALKTCPDLLTDVVQSLSRAKIEQLIACSGEPSVVDEIWDGPKSERTPSSAGGGRRVQNDESDFQEPAPKPVAKPQETKPAAKTQEPAAKPKQEAAPEPDDIDAEEAAVLARIAAKRKAKQEEAAKAAASVTQVQSSASLEEDEFLNKFQPQ